MESRAKRRNKLTYDEDDIYNLRLVAWKEARGEGAEGCRAVMHSVCNRVISPGFPRDLHSVIYQKNAYSSMSRPSDPQYNLQPPENDALWSLLDPLARQILAGSDPDLTAHPITHAGAKFYANLATMEKDGWFERNIVERPDLHPMTVKILHHTFFV